MIQVTQNSKSTYLIKLGEPDISWVIEAAKGMGIDRCSILAAAFSKGLQYYFDMIREIEHHDKNKTTSDCIVMSPEKDIDCDDGDDLC